MKIICPYCGRDTNVIEGDHLPIFCFYCRKLLPHRFCKKCGYGILHEDSNYCNMCGARIPVVKDPKDEAPTV